ncbi:hypothetical protein H8E77_27895 [bacterium]|nr:hypothetical protein [bacterium]
MRHIKEHHLRGLSFLTFVLLILGNGGVAATEIKTLWHSGRQLFYESVEDKSQINPAIHIFQQIIQLNKADEGRAMTYLGVLTALKGKHAFLPHKKLKFVKQGLALMDKGIEISPDDAEALFIHGCTCYYLPFFFKRGDDAQRDFKKILRILPAQIHAYDIELINNALKFIAENAELDAKDREYIRQINLKLPH